MTTVAITSVNPNAQQKVGQTPKELGLNLAWSKDEQGKIKRILARYPKEQARSATIPLLKLAQDKCAGWLPVDAMQLVADTLNLPYVRVYEVATFYTMFNLKPVGKFHVQVCTNCSCLIRGSDAIVQAVKDVTGIKKSGQNSADGMFTFTEVECLGACVSAPMMQIGTHYYTHLDAAKTKQVLEDLCDKGSSKLVDTPEGDTDPIDFGTYQERV